MDKVDISNIFVELKHWSSSELPCDVGSSLIELSVSVKASIKFKLLSDKCVVDEEANIEGDALFSEFVNKLKSLKSDSIFA